MDDSILTSTKKILGVDATYTAFDLDIITHINSALSSLNQIGIGPALGLTIEDDSALWSDLGLPPNQEGMVKPYVYLKTRMLFDPPGTGFLVDAMKEQIREHEWRLSTFREETVPPFLPKRRRVLE